MNELMRQIDCGVRIRASGKSCYAYIATRSGNTYNPASLFTVLLFSSMIDAGTILDSVRMLARRKINPAASSESELNRALRLSCHGTTVVWTIRDAVEVAEGEHGPRRSSNGAQGRKRERGKALTTCWPGLWDFYMYSHMIPIPIRFSFSRCILRTYVLKSPYCPSSLLLLLSVRLNYADV